MPFANIAGDAPEFNAAAAPGSKLYYLDLGGSETYSGTKEQLQTIGLGCYALFPKEPGGPRRRLRVSDTLGRTWSIWSEGWKGANRYRAERKKSKAEADASQRLHAARAELASIMTDPLKVKYQSATLVLLARKHLEGLIVGPDFRPTTQEMAALTPKATMRLPLEIRSCLVELIDELKEVEQDIRACDDLEPDPEVIAERESLQRTIELYSNPAFVGVLGKKTRSPGAFTSGGGR